MIEINMLIPGDAPIWFRKAWKGVCIAWNTVAHGEFVTVPTSVAIAGLRQKNPGAAYYWDCCMASSAGSMMAFPVGICNITSDRVSERPMGRREVPPWTDFGQIPN